MRKEHMYQHKSHIGEFVKVSVFAAQSNPDRALLFHVLTDDGLVRSRVPIHMLCHKQTAPQMSLDYLQLWDCFSVNCTAVVYEYLKAARAKVVLKDKQELWGEYMMSFDWYGNPYSDEPTQYKSLHMIRLDNGCYTLQPNNRIFWKHMSFVTNPFPTNPDFKVDDKVFRCEAASDRWVIEGEDDSYYYDLKNEIANCNIEKSK
jgi:hypothetical protein